MTFTEIYKLTTKFWQTDIDISDGKILMGNGGFFKKLSKVWDEVELKTESESEFIQLMVWGIYCGYHKKAIENFEVGKMTVSLAELDIKYIKHRFEESLLNPTYKEYTELRNIYKKEKQPKS